MKQITKLNIRSINKSKNLNRSFHNSVASRKHILVTLEGQENAKLSFDKTLEFAKKNEDTLYFFNPESGAVQSDKLSGHTSDLSKKYEEKAKNKGFVSKTIFAESREKRSISKQIEEAVKKNNIDFIVTAKGKTSLEDYFLDSKNDVISKERINRKFNEKEGKYDSLREKSDSNLEKGQQRIEDAKDRAYEMKESDSFTSKIGDAFQATKEKLGEWKDSIMNSKSAEKVQESAEELKEKASEKFEDAKEKLGEWRDVASEQVVQAKRKSSEFVHDAKEKASEKFEDAKEKAYELKDQVSEKIEGRRNKESEEYASNKKSEFRNRNLDEEDNRDKKYWNHDQKSQHAPSSAFSQPDNLRQYKYDNFDSERSSHLKPKDEISSFSKNEDLRNAASDRIGDKRQH